MRFLVKVKPGSRKGPLIEVSGEGELIAFLRERPIDGAANEALIELLAKHYSVKKNQVRIESGFAGRTKRVAID
ncbi:MAG: hypothetical protein RIR16_653 [Actinomycetota bacterium]|jgi:uncharacterized protein YggU (UPF0235/DUF167 family)